MSNKETKEQGDNKETNKKTKEPETSEKSGEDIGLMKVQRLKKGPRNIPRSISVDPETNDILNQVGKDRNVSKWVCEAVKEKWNREQGGRPYLLVAEEEFWGQVHTFFCNRFFQESKKWFPEILTPELSTDIFDQAEENLKGQLECNLYPEQVEDVRAAQRLVRKAREDPEYWRGLYQKFRTYWAWYKDAPSERGLLK